MMIRPYRAARRKKTRNFSLTGKRGMYMLFIELHIKYTIVHSTFGGTGHG
jgi:hypothetical protein